MNYMTSTVGNEQLAPPNRGTTEQLLTGVETGSSDGVERVTIKVMIIDDSNTIRRTAEALLKKAGYEVLTASDGFEAMSMITDHNPDIIFVDIMMPRLDGYQTCQLIKNNKKFRDTPVIMLSSKDGLFDRARGRIAGSEEHVNKPFTQEELIDVINKYVH
jgi:twitching motility two-component system response regulator PilG